MAGIRKLYQPTGIAGGPGYYPIWENFSGWTFPQGNGSGLPYGLGVYSMPIGGSTPSAQLVFTGTDLDIFFTRQAGAGNLVITIDGVQRASVPTSGTGQGIAYRYSGLSASSHTLVVTCTGGNGTAILEGVMAYNGDTVLGLRSWSAGHSGYTTNDYANTQWAGALSTATPNLVFVYLGINDRYQSYTPDQFKANLQTIVSQIKAKAPSPTIVLMKQYDWYIAPGQAYPTSQYSAKIDEIVAADPNYCMSLDLNALIGPTYSLATDMADLMSDAVHPNPQGMQMIADAALAAVLPSGSISSSSGGSGTPGATGATGPAGATGAAGTVGATGARGATGAQGNAGLAGATGAAGSPGSAGSTGATGPAGSAGGQGATGPIGATGAAGSSGSVGATGARGVSFNSDPVMSSSPPSISISATTASSMAGGSRISPNGSSLFVYPGVDVTSAGTISGLTNCVAQTGIDVSPSGTPYNLMAVEFETDAPIVDLFLFGTTNSTANGGNCARFSIEVDGEMITADPYATALAENVWSRVTIPFGSVKRRRITFRSMYTQFGGVSVDVTKYKVWKTARDFGPKTIVFMDSFGTGGSSTDNTFATPAVLPWVWNSYAIKAGRILGWNTFPSAVGATSWFYDGGFGQSVANRYDTDGHARKPDQVVFAIGLNDRGQNLSSVQAAINSTLASASTSVNSKGRKTKVFALAPICTIPGFYTALTTIAGFVESACSKYGATYVPGPLDYISGTGRMGSPNGTGNADIYLSNDLIHLNPEGYDYIGKRLAGEISEASRANWIGNRALDSGLVSTTDDLGVVSVKAYGAVPDGRANQSYMTEIGDGGKTRLTTGSTSKWGSVSAKFRPTDVGKTIRIDNAGTTVAPNGNNGGTRGWWITTVTDYISPTSVRVDGTPAYGYEGMPYAVVWGTDSTQAIATAITHLTPGKKLYFPASEEAYLCDGGFTLPVQQAVIEGDNPYTSMIISYGLSQSVFTTPTGYGEAIIRNISAYHAAFVQCTDSINFGEWDQLVPELTPTAPTSGAFYMAVDGGYDSLIQNCKIAGYYYGLYLHNSALTRVEKCQIICLVYCGIYFKNDTIDWGGPMIEYNWIGNSHSQYTSSGAYGFLWEGGGGAHFVGGQVNGMADGVVFRLTGDASYGTSQCQVIGVGFEDHGDAQNRWNNTGGYHVKFQVMSNITGNADMVGLVIANNHFAQALGTSQNAIYLGSNAGTGGGRTGSGNARIGHVAVTGNTMFNLTNLAYLERVNNVKFVGNVGNSTTVVQGSYCTNVTVI
jgi:lysophospholipase L1-like esterase